MKAREKAIIVAARTPKNRRGFEERLDELEQLVRHAGAEPVLTVVQNRRSLDPAYLIGKGKVLEVARAADELGAELVVFLNRLSPRQHENLEELIGVKVIDRIALILDIFAQRARTIEGKLQVEMAQLTYLLPRLIGYGRMMSRLGGGIGTRGPGETKLEIDRRRIIKRLQNLRRKIAKVRRIRETQRKRRLQGGGYVVSVIGYTNAGKSTLFNLLTKSDVYVDDKAFATLDPTVRKLRVIPPELSGLRENVLLVDTVGFIRDLPKELMAAFRATFEELEYSDLFLHLVDASSPYVEDHIASVEAILENMGLSGIPRILVFNKIDLLDEGKLEALKNKYPEALFISAKSGLNVGELLLAMKQALEELRALGR